jgi:hypothetical protein
MQILKPWLALALSLCCSSATSPPAVLAQYLSADVAKALACPVFHVNADDAEAVVRLFYLAITCLLCSRALCRAADARACVHLQRWMWLHSRFGWHSIIAQLALLPASSLQTRVCELAAEWRQEFKTDVVIDLIGYRRYGCAACCC